MFLVVAMSHQLVTAGRQSIMLTPESSQGLEAGQYVSVELVAGLKLGQQPVGKTVIGHGRH